MRPLPLWQKGCLGCVSLPVILLALVVVVAIAAPMVDPEGHARRVEAQQREQEAADRSRAEDEQRRAARQREEEVAAKQEAARAAEAAKRRLEVKPTPEEATVTLFLEGSQIAQKAGTCEFEGLTPGNPYTIKVSAPRHETRKLQVSVPRSGPVLVALAELPDLEVLSVDSESDSFAWYATGKVRNNTERTYGYVQVEVGLLDAQGELVGSTLANVNNLRPGQVWKFRALVVEDRAEKFRIEGVTGF